jgi:putative addiction module component (TIGR02574 family)
MDDDWRERLEEGIRRLPVPQRAALIERLVVAHESYEEIMESWAVEIQRRIAEIDEDETRFVPMEEVFAKLRARKEAITDWQPPPVPDNIVEIEEQALHLTNDDFFGLLVHAESELPRDFDPRWRTDIRRRIEAIPAEIERRYREQDTAGGSIEPQIGWPGKTDPP